MFMRRITRCDQRYSTLRLLVLWHRYVFRPPGRGGVVKNLRHAENCVTGKNVTFFRSRNVIKKTIASDIIGLHGHPDNSASSLPLCYADKSRTFRVIVDGFWLVNVSSFLFVGCGSVHPFSALTFVFVSFAFVPVVDFVFLYLPWMFDFSFYSFLSATQWFVINWYTKLGD